MIQLEMFYFNLLHSVTNKFTLRLITNKNSGVCKFTDRFKLTFDMLNIFLN